VTAKKALVTGGAGFIGSHIVEGLLGRGLEVVVVDNLSTGRKEQVAVDARLLEMDIRDAGLAKVFAQHRPDVVFHAAAQASVVVSSEDPLVDAESNIMGSLNLLQACREHGIERFIYCSTGGALYGEPERLPCDEQHPIHPTSPYGVSKATVELYLHSFSILCGLNYTVLRYGNVYGPRQDPFGEAGVIAIFSQRMLRGEGVTIFGDGLQERDFVYVSDVVEANLQAIGQDENGVYNIGTGRGANVNGLFERLTRLTDSPLEPHYEPARKGEVYKVYLDVARARAGLEWEAKVGLDEGLALTVDSFR
jgi:UDP-glucose 4-epimerase